MEVYSEIKQEIIDLNELLLNVSNNRIQLIKAKPKFEISTDG